MIADTLVLVALVYVDRGMKAEKQFREMEAEHRVRREHESGKANTRAEKSAVREQQKQAQRAQKHTQKNGGVSKKHNIQQPSKHD